MGEVNVNPARRAAFESILKMKYGRYSNLEVNTTLNRTKMSDADKGLYTALTYGVLERIITLDHVISKYSKTPIEKLDGEALCALRLGIYQLSYMDRIPDHAAVDESVTLAGKRAGGYVNGVLRSFLRSGKNMHLPKCDDYEKYLSITYSVPEELTRLFVKWYEKDAEKIFKAFLERERISLRVNTLKHTAKEVAKSLSGEVSKISPHTVLVDSFAGIAEGIEAGDWFVQDQASALCASVVDAKAGDTVADTCACPGGKSFNLALQMDNSGELYSFDIHANKLSLVEKGAKKLGINIIQTEERDARNPKEELVGKCQKVLCDAPCSGMGIIGKKPDIKYKDIDSILRLPKIQYDVLCGASQYVSDGGVLVYSTCTLNPEENEEICKRFLSEHKEFALCPFEIGGIKSVGMLTMLPHIHGTDGFFICKMQRGEQA